MKGLIVSYKRGRHLIHPRHAIIKLEGIEDKNKANSFAGSKVSYATRGGKILKGVVTKSHGNKGLVIARFETGIPGQAISSEVLVNAKEAEKKEVKKAPVKKTPAKKAKK